jgi:hypothetical protein
LQRGDSTWRQFFENEQESMDPRIVRYIANLRMLHKSAEEAKLDVIRQRLEEMEEEGEEQEPEMVEEGNIEGLHTDDIESDN